MIFACDESGAKGHADVDESFPGEVGVFVGILISDECRERALREFQAIYDTFRPTAGKLHITDLAPGVQDKLRTELYGQIRALDLPCFWYAVHVAGFHDWHSKESALLAPLRPAPEATKRFRPGSPRNRRPSLHVALFEGLYGQLVAYLEERERRRVTIDIRMDRVDSPIAQNFERVANDLLSLDPVVEELTAFDIETRKRVVMGQVSISTLLPPAFQLQVTIETLTLHPVANDGAVLAADVLANSLNHHFNKRGEQDRYAPLNRPEAIAGHPLERNLCVFHDWGIGDLGDRLWRHPSAPRSAE